MQLARNLPMDDDDPTTFIEFHWSVCQECNATGDVTLSKAADEQWTQGHTDRSGHFRYDLWTVQRVKAQVWTQPRPLPPLPPV